MSFQFRFTIVTPFFNSEKFIGRTLQSIKSQNFKNFEWFVINDASKDNTGNFINDFMNLSEIPIVYHNLKINQGLLNNYNLAIKEARGEFIVFLGHDDEMLPEALETFDCLIKKYDSPEIGAVYALAKDQNGSLIGKKYPNEEFISDYWTQFFALGNEMEKFQCFRTDYLREIYPIITEGDFRLPAAWLWGYLGLKYKAIFVNKVLRIYYTNTLTSLTKTTNRGDDPIRIYNYYLYWINEFQYQIKGNPLRRLRGIAGFASYGLLARKNISQQLAPVKGYKNKLLVLLLIPLAYLYNKCH